jgi:hypothetical protein
MRFVFVLALAYVGLVIVFYGLQTSMIFPRGSSIWRTPSDPPFGWTYEDVTLDVDGESTHGWYIPVENPRGTVLFSHGNAGTIADRLESIEVFRNLGLNVFIYDYGGYGNSSGKPSEKRCYADVRAAWKHVTETRGEPPARIVLFGRSLGAGPTIELAQDMTPGAIIIESAFISSAQMGKELLPFIPVGWLIRHRFDNAKKIGNIKTPILVIHSPDDDTIPYRHGQRLFELAPEPKTFLEIHGDHNTGWYDSGMLYREGIGAFLKPILATGDGEVDSAK